MNEHRKVLMVAYNYPPVAGVGIVRTTRLARHLPRLGWAPTVLTVTRDRTRWGSGDAAEGEFDGVGVLRAPFPDVLTALNRLLERAGLLKGSGQDDEPGAAGVVRGGGPVVRASRRVFSWAKRWSAFPDRHVLWIPFAFARGLRELRRGRYSVVYSTSPPVSGHITAALLNAATGIPWVADFRDPWRHGYRAMTATEERLHRLLETVVLRRASAIVAVSPVLAREARSTYGERPCGVRCITNGFDPGEHPAGSAPPADAFVITYTGALFGLRQDPAPLLEVLDEMANSGEIDPSRVRVRFFGPREPGLVSLVERLSHPEMVEVHGVVPRAEALKAQRESTVLLVLLWDDPYTSRIYGGKAMEYLGARRPILAWNPSGGILGDLLERTGAGVAVGDRASLRRALASWYEEFARTGSVSFHGEESELERYSWEDLAREMATVLDCAAGVR